MSAQPTKIDKQKWTTDRLDIEAQIRALKHLIREEPRDMTVYDPKTFQPSKVQLPYGTSQDYQYLAALKFKATLLYKVRAQYRGKQHQLREVSYVGMGTKQVEVLTLEKEREAVIGLMEHYALPEPQLAAS